MIKRLLSGVSAVILSVSSLFVFVPSIVHASTADTCTFQNASLVSNAAVFNNASNWSCATDTGEAPSTGDTLVFNVTGLTANATVDNDMTGMSFAAIQFIGTDNGFGFTITGNAMTLTSGVTASVPNNNLKTDVTAGGNLTFNVGGYFSVNGTGKTFNLGTNTLSVTGSGSLYISDKLSGSGAITNAANVQLGNSANDFTSAITNTGSVYFYNKGALGGSSYISGGNDSRFYVATGSGEAASDETIENSITISGDGTTTQGGGGTYTEPAMYVNITNYIDVGQGAIRTDVSKLKFTHITLSGDATYGSSMSSDDTVTFSGATLNDHKLTRLDGSQGKLIVNDTTIDSNFKLSEFKEASTTASTFFVTDKERYVVTADRSKTVATVWAGGNLRVDKDGKLSDVTVKAGGTVDGTDGVVGKLKIESGGFVAPGHSPGCLNSGDLTENGTYKAELGGTTACSGYDQLKVAGTVDLTNGTLEASLYNGFKPKAKDAFTIIDNDGSDAVTGTFKDLAEGATFKLSGYVMKVTYKGGDGNDVVVTVMSVPNSPDTGFSMMMNNPAALLATTTVAAFGILMISRRLAPKKVRR